MVTGLATLSWEVIWQIKASLALGVSAWGTAITLAVTMGGMSVGSILIGYALRDKFVSRPIRLYGALELIIGVSGLFLGATFQAIENLDTRVYAEMPGNASLVYIFGIVSLLGVPAICMGATFPVFGLIARQFNTSIAVLYGLNTLGAATGVLLAAFFLIPQFGITHSAWIIAALNISVAISTWVFFPGKSVASRQREKKIKTEFSPAAESLVVFITGFATFSLEIAWFRSLTATFHSTTDAFAIMLASILLALGIAASLVPLLRKKVSLGSLITWAGILILLATPLIERFGLISFPYRGSALLVINWFILTFYVVGMPVLLLGTAFPWILDEQHSARKWGMLYALNTLAAIAGALGAAWVLLPAIGFARTAWLTGALVAVTGIIVSPRKRRFAWGIMGILGLLIAVTFESGIGRTSLRGNFPAKILEFYEGPESTVAAVEYESKRRGLIIDGVQAAVQYGGFQGKSSDRYMAWMGHLPMLLHPDPKTALVICFGTGQTANAVRRENPDSVDIVDINPRVIKLAHNFDTNQNVLGDPKVRVTIMDGRAYMRRTTNFFDVITLEPMPPNFAGVNALYSREFYELARKKMTPNGMIAQWVPFHLVASPYAISIATTFRDVFPNAILWADPVSKTGILLGTADESKELGTDWPGFKRLKMKREFSEAEVREAIVLDRKHLKNYSDRGEVISDDNQLLAYGKAVSLGHVPAAILEKENIDILEQEAGK